MKWWIGLISRPRNLRRSEFFANGRCHPTLWINSWTKPFWASEHPLWSQSLSRSAFGTLFVLQPGHMLLVYKFSFHCWMMQHWSK
jgi:hypothetical protein